MTLKYLTLSSGRVHCRRISHLLSDKTGTLTQNGIVNVFIMLLCHVRLQAFARDGNAETTNGNDVARL